MQTEAFYSYRGGIHPMGRLFYCTKYIPGLEVSVFISDSGVDFCTYVGSTSSLFGQTASTFDVEEAVEQYKKSQKPTAKP